MEIIVCVKSVPGSADNQIEVNAAGSYIKRSGLVYTVYE